MAMTNPLFYYFVIIFDNYRLCAKLSIRVDTAFSVAASKRASYW